MVEARVEHVSDSCDECLRRQAGHESMKKTERVKGMLGCGSTHLGCEGRDDHRQDIKHEASPYPASDEVRITFAQNDAHLGKIARARRALSASIFPACVIARLLSLSLSPL